jgi:hypothetical protein
MHDCFEHISKRIGIVAQLGQRLTEQGRRSQEDSLSGPDRILSRTESIDGSKRILVPPCEHTESRGRLQKRIPVSSNARVW